MKCPHFNLSYFMSTLQILFPVFQQQACVISFPKKDIMLRNRRSHWEFQVPAKLEIYFFVNFCFQVRHGDKQIEMLKEKNSELFERIHELVNNPTSLNSPSFLEELEYSQKSLTSGYSSNLSLLDELDSDEAITMLPVDNFSQVSYVRTYVDVKLFHS